MRLTQWQTNPKLVKDAKDLYEKNQTFRLMLEVALEESPVKGPPTFTSGEHQNSRELGFIQGYHHLLELFKAMRTMPQAPKPIESKFDPPEQ